MAARQEKDTAGAFRLPDLKALYSRSYSESDERWRELGAIDKARHIVGLLGPHREHIRTVLEVGCGTGAVLRQLHKAHLGTSLTGIEIGTSNRAADKEVEGIQFRGYDGEKIPFEDRSFDFVYATHVLEHVAHPRKFLSEIRRVAKGLVLIEVPCELHLRSSIRSLQTTLNIGHINAYTPEALALTLETSGFRLLRQDIYDVSFKAQAYNASTLKAAVAWLVRRSLLRTSKTLASRMMTYHSAALCKVSETLEL